MYQILEIMCCLRPVFIVRSNRNKFDNNHNMAHSFHLALVPVRLKNAKTITPVLQATSGPPYRSGVAETQVRPRQLVNNESAYS